MARASIVQRLQRGDVLHMQLWDSRRHYWFESPYQAVSESAFQEAETQMQLVGVGDCLFPHLRISQSIIAAKGGDQ